MGQKVNPIGFRLKINANTWDSIWYANKGYKQKLHQDLCIRNYINKSFKHAGISKVIIERKNEGESYLVYVTIHSSRSGVIIGKKGSDVEKIKQAIAKEVKGNAEVNVIEVKRSETDAAVIAYSIVQQLEKRVSFRRAMKKAIQSCMRMGGKGIKVSCSGRLGGAEIARTEWYKEGCLPLHTLRANVDYAVREARTIYGIIGVKVWVCISN